MWRSINRNQCHLSGTGPARSAREIAEQIPNGIDLVIDGGEVRFLRHHGFGCDWTSARIIREGASQERVGKGAGSVIIGPFLIYHLTFLIFFHMFDELQLSLSFAEVPTGISKRHYPRRQPLKKHIDSSEMTIEMSNDI